MILGTCVWQGTPEPDLEVPLLFNIQDENLSAFLDVNVKAANHSVNTSNADFVVCRLLLCHHRQAALPSWLNWLWG